MCRHAGEVKHAGHNGDCAAGRKAQVRGDKQSGNRDSDADDARPDKQRLWRDTHGRRPAAGATSKAMDKMVPTAGMTAAIVKQIRPSVRAS